MAAADGPNARNSSDREHPGPRYPPLKPDENQVYVRTRLKQQDPQLPKSIWYLTDAKFLGFRIIRPLEIPTAEEMFYYWNNGVEKE